jgi:hypothetical protein
VTGCKRKKAALPPFFFSAPRLLAFFARQHVFIGCARRYPLSLNNLIRALRLTSAVRASPRVTFGATEKIFL